MNLFKLNVTVCGVLVAGALVATTSEAQIFGSDPEGVKQTDSLIKKAQDVVKEGSSARTELSKTLDTYNALFAKDTQDIRKTYKDIESAMGKTEKKREDVKTKLDAMKVEADAYFVGWESSLQQIESENLRERSKERMSETKAKYDGVLASVSAAREAYEPLMKNLSDQWTYLGHDLNASGIESLKPDSVELNKKAKEVLGKIDDAMKDANEYIASIEASRPAS